MTLRARPPLRTASIAAGVAVLLAPLLTRADAPTSGEDSAYPAPIEGDVTLDYRRGPGASACPDEAALRERTADAFDFRDPFVSPGNQATGHIRVELGRAPAGFTARVLIVDDAGAERTSSTEQHADCDALMWVVAHRLALAIVRRPKPAATPTATPTAPPTAEPLPPKPPESPTSKPVAVPAPPPSRPLCDARCQEERKKKPDSITRPRVPLQWSVTAGGLATAGWSDELGAGAWFGAALRRGSWSIGAELRGTFPSPALRHSETLVSTTASASFAAVPCVHWKVLSGCVPVEVGPFFFLVPTEPTSVLLDTLFTVGPRVALEVPIAGGVAVKLFADLRILPRVPVFAVDVETRGNHAFERWHTNVATGLLGLGLTLTP